MFSILSIVAVAVINAEKVIDSGVSNGKAIEEPGKTTGDNAEEPKTSTLSNGAVVVVSDGVTKTISATGSASANSGSKDAKTTSAESTQVAKTTSTESSKDAKTAEGKSVSTSSTKSASAAPQITTIKDKNGNTTTADVNGSSKKTIVGEDGVTTIIGGGEVKTMSAGKTSTDSASTKEAAASTKTETDTVQAEVVSLSKDLDRRVEEVINTTTKEPTDLKVVPVNYSSTDNTSSAVVATNDKYSSNLLDSRKNSYLKNKTKNRSFLSFFTKAVSHKEPEDEGSKQTEHENNKTTQQPASAPQVTIKNVHQQEKPAKKKPTKQNPATVEALNTTTPKGNKPKSDAPTDDEDGESSNKKQNKADIQEDLPNDLQDSKYNEIPEPRRGWIKTNAKNEKIQEMNSNLMKSFATEEPSDSAPSSDDGKKSHLMSEEYNARLLD